jgi:secretion/DNA translocation related TadE-like protein
MRRPAGDGGTATAELAVAVPAVGVLLSAVVAVAQAGVAQVEVVDAARAGARAAARGDDLGRVRSVAADAASGRRGGGSATVDVGASGAMVRVTVSRRVRLVLRRGPSVKVSASAVALRENGSATVLVLAVAFAAVILATLLAGIGSVAVSRHRAASAADLGALAAADVLVGRSSGSPCGAAAIVVAAAGAALGACRTAGSTAEVVATVRPAGLPGRLGRVRVRARAGPSPARAAAAAVRSSRRVLVSRCACRPGLTRMALGRGPGRVQVPVSQVSASRARSKEGRPNRAGTAAVCRSVGLAARLRRRSLIPRRGADGAGIRA